jgi:tetratricopeptide (TPR) repeat protein
MRLYRAALYKAGRYTDAKKWLTRVLKDAPNEHAFFFLGMTYFKQEKFDSAAVFMQKAIDETESPNLAEYHANLAISMEKDGQLEECLPHYNEALLRTGNPDLIFRMAIVNEELRRIETAKRLYVRYLVITPEEDTSERLYAKERLKDLKVAEFMDTQED